MSLQKSFLVTTVFLAIVSASVIAEVPRLLNYQGRITDDRGRPVSDGDYAITFSIWDAEVGGISYWSEAQPNVTITDGVLSVLLGSVIPISDSVFAGPDRYLELFLKGDAITPRIRLTSVGYAYRISTIDGAAGGTITDPLVIIPSESGLSLSPKTDAQASKARIEIGFEGQSSSISMFEPVDSKMNLSAGDGKRVEIRGSGLVMFGASEFDTTLIVEPNGNIRGVGQITMGQNSSDGTNTTVLGFANTADGDSSTIGGGSANIASASVTVISGGHANTASAEGATIGGGSFNTASGMYATIAGGHENQASGDYATVPGGYANNAEGLHSYSAGHRAKAVHDGSYVWADHTEDDFSSTGEDQYIIRAQGGVGIGTNEPSGLLEVASSDGDVSVVLPFSSISAPETLDEAGIASNRETASILLPQGSLTMTELIRVAITVPAAGYIVLRAGGVFEATGTNKRNQTLVQIVEAPGGAVEPAYVVQAGSGDYDTPSRTHYSIISTERIFAKDVGTYEFLFEAMAHTDNGSDAISHIQKPQITAIYYPTAYGSVAGIVASSELGDYTTGEFIGQALDPSLTANPVRIQDYRVDLRELELRAMRTRLEAEKAEKELLEAMLLNR